jgi:DNA-binding response OmpR family regulator
MVALELGADEYLPKAATGRELLLRVNALARRARPLPPVGDPREQYGLLELDRTGFRVWVDGQPRDLTAGEFRLLVALATPAGTVHPRVRLREALEPGERSEGDRFIDARVARLRERLGDAGSQIVTVRGVGYRLDTRVPATGGRSAGA